jgi:hypothetical protein
MADWHQIPQAEWLTVAYRIPDSVMRAEFVYLAVHCLNVGAFLDSDEEIAFISGLPIEHITQMRPYLNRLSERKDGNLVITISEHAIAERAAFNQRQADRARGKKTQPEQPPPAPGDKEKPPDRVEGHGKPRQATAEPPFATEEPRQATASRGEPITDIQTYRHTDIQELASSREDAASAESEAREYQRRAGRRGDEPRSRWAYEQCLEYVEASSPGKPPIAAARLAQKLQKTGEDDQAIAAWKKLTSDQAALPRGRPRRDCEKCKGKGWRWRDWPAETGQMVECECKNEAIAA